METIAGALCGNHRHWRFTIATMHDHQQVGLFCFRRQARAGATALNIDHNERQLKNHAQANTLAFQSDTRSTAGGHGHRSTKGGTDGGANGSDFVLGLKRTDAKIFVLA